LSSTIQETSRETESRGDETSRSRGSQRVGGRKNIEKKSKKNDKVLNTIEGVYSRT